MFLRSKKHVTSQRRRITMRRFRRLCLRFLCHLFPFCKTTLHFFETPIPIDRIATMPPVATYEETATLEEKDAVLSEAEKDFIRRCWNQEEEIIPEHVEGKEAFYLAEDLTIYGRTGAMVHQERIVVDSFSNAKEVSDNRCKPSLGLKKVPADARTCYYSMVEVAKGHKQFYHFFIDFLFRLFCLARAIEKNQINQPHITILVNHDLARYQEKAYAYLMARYPSIAVQKLAPSEYIHAKKLLYFERTQNIHTSFLSPEYLAFIHRIFQPESLPKFAREELKGRYYISRNDTKNRHVENEKALTPLLEAYGFEVIYPTTLPLEKQIEIFATAEVILAPIGAALTNIIHAHPSTKIGLFYPDGLLGSQYLWLAKAVGIKKVEHVSAGKMRGRRKHFTISQALLEQTLEALKLPPAA